MENGFHFFLGHPVKCYSSVNKDSAFCKLPYDILNTFKAKRKE